MRYRKLRIAWSVWWGAAAVLLVVLWVRSYSWFDQLWVSLPFGRKLGLLSLDSCVSVSLERNPDGAMLFGSSDVNLNSNLRPKTYWGFLFAREPSCTYGYVPFWFLIASVIGVAITPWLSWRFSLRTLLIAITLVAVVLGLVVWASK